MDKATKTLADKVTRLEKIVHGLVNAPRKQDEQSIYQQDDANQEHATAKIHSVIAPKTAPPIHHSNKTNKRWYRRIHWWKVLEGGGIVSVIVYAVLTYLQWRDLHDNFIKEQMPVVWPDTKTDVGPVFEVEKPIYWTVTYTNFGRSAALKMSMCGKMRFGNTNDAYLGIIPPTSTDACTGFFGEGTLSSVVPPGHSAYFTGSTKIPIGANDIANVRSVSGGLAMAGIFDYEDLSGHKYRSTFCMYRLNTGAIANCAKYNTIEEIK